MGLCSNFQTIFSSTVSQNGWAVLEGIRFSSVFGVGRSDYSLSMSEEKGMLICQKYDKLILDSKAGGESLASNREPGS